MTICQQQFVQIIRAAVLNEEAPDEVDWPGVLRLAQMHHLETVVWKVAENHPSLPDEMKLQMGNLFYSMVARDMKQDWCLDQIEQALSRAGVHFAPIKGALLKQDYPMTSFRFMSDLDFYIKPEDRSRIREALESIGAVFRGTESGDEQFLFWNELGIEFHGRLLYRKSRGGIENYSDWSYVEKDRDRLKEEGFALNLIGHAVHDLAGSGPGIRYILDLWIYRNRHTPQPDWNAVNEKMKQDGIFEAASNLLNLSEYLFGHFEESPLMVELADYVLEGGLHGDYNRGLASQAAKGNAAWRQLFRTRSEYENRYPWLKQYPFLLPAAWTFRVFDSLRRHRKQIARWAHGMKNRSVDEIEMQKQRLARFGL